MDDCSVDQIVTKFFLDTCVQRPRTLSKHAVNATSWASTVATEHPPDDTDAHFNPLTTGSVAEFYIEPMLPHFGDIDVMLHPSNDMAIPRGHPPPTQLPAEFSNGVSVYEIVDSYLGLPGYVYLKQRYFLRKCIDDEKYTCTEHEHKPYLPNRDYTAGDDGDIHGPAIVTYIMSQIPVDAVHSVRCLSWLPQSADWPTRHRNCLLYTSDAADE